MRNIYTAVLKLRVHSLKVIHLLIFKTQCTWFLMAWSHLPHINKIFTVLIKENKLKKSFLLHILKWGNKKVILNITLQRTNNFLTLIHPTIMQISSKALRKVIMKIYQINRLKETLIIQTLRINFLKKVMLLKLHILQIHNLMDPIATLIRQCIKLLKNSFLNFLKIHTKVSVTIILLISKRSEIRKTVSNFFQKIMDFLATLIILILNLILH